MSSLGEGTSNGRAEDETFAELDELVAAELEAVGAPQEPPIEAVLERLATRLREHPERAALLDRLRAMVDGAPPEPPAD